MVRQLASTAELIRFPPACRRAHDHFLVRVAFVTNLAPHYRRPLFEAFARQADVDFFFFSRGQERYLSGSMRHEAGDFRHVDLPVYRIGRQTLMPGLAWRLSRKRYDLVVKCLNGKLMLPWVYGVARAQGLPIVLWTGLWFHPTTLLNRLGQVPLLRMYRGADAIIAYGDHVQQYLVTRADVDPARVFVAGQAVAGALFESGLNDQPRPPTALFVGQLEHRKGADGLIAAFRRVGVPGAQLRVVGSGSERMALTQLASSDARIAFLGQLSQQDLAAELASARCLVLPSVTTADGREPWGLVVNEAMHAGVPVIASSAVGAAAGGLVVDRRNGRVVPERDTGALATALTDLLGDASKAAALGRQAAEDVQRFSFDAMTTAFVAACEHAIARSR